MRVIISKSCKKFPYNKYEKRIPVRPGGGLTPAAIPPSFSAMMIETTIRLAGLLLINPGS